MQKIHTFPLYPPPDTLAPTQPESPPHERCPLVTDALLDADRRHLIHPLHHPKDHANARVFVRGEAAMLHTSGGREYIDGLSALWNVNAGHGREALAQAAGHRWKSWLMRQHT